MLKNDGSHSVGLTNQKETVLEITPYTTTEEAFVFFHFTFWPILYLPNAP